MTHSYFTTRAFWVLFPHMGGVLSAFIGIFNSSTVTGQFRQLRNNDIHSICPVSLPRFAGSHPKHQTEFRVSTPASMGARIVALPPVSLLLSWQKKCRVESWVSLELGLYWCLLSRRLHARGMLLVYLARDSLCRQIGPFTFHSPSR